MEGKERALFGQAIHEALSNQYERALARCDEDAHVSVSHTRKIRRILNGRAARPRVTAHHLSARMWVALLLAAILLFTTLVVGANWHKIREFIITVRRGHNEVTYDGERGGRVAPIEKLYELSYVPEGYEKTAENTKESVMDYMFKNREGESLRFIQAPLYSGHHKLDTEHGNTQRIEWNGKQIYCGEYKLYDIYLWNDGIYEMSLEVPSRLSEEEVIRIIAGIQEKT